MVYIPVKDGVTVKGAVLVCAGGAFQFRSNENEGFPVAEQLSGLGYQAFVVNYRLRPYTQAEGALDLARAVRHVRNHAAELGIDKNDIAVIGFSAGGILCGEMLLNYDGFTDGTSLDQRYVPDELDKVSADAAAVGMIYSFYGRLSVASTDVEKFKASDLPPAYFLYGTRDPFVSQFEACVAALRQAEIPVESHALEGWPHGFGAADGRWILDFDKWLTPILKD
jgi:acetyl esterase/lipase